MSTKSSTANSLQRWQAVTGLIVAVFVAMHLINTWLAVFGPGVYDPVQRGFGWLYQSLVFEVLLISSIYIHLTIGFIRIWREPKRALTTRARLHRYAGIFLALVITGHIGAVRGASWFADVWPRFEGIAFTLEYLPEVFLPYYLLLATAGFYHAVNGAAIALPRLTAYRMRLTTPALKLGTFAAAGASLLALFAFAGVFFDVGDVLNSEFGRLFMELTDESTAS